MAWPRNFYVLRKRKHKKRKFDPDQVHTGNLYLRAKYYNTTVQALKDLAIKQGFICAICGKGEEKLINQLCIDHDHTTNKVRGLLCRSCNYGLGCFFDSAHNLMKASMYLEDPPYVS